MEESAPESVPETSDQVAPETESEASAPTESAPNYTGTTHVVKINNKEVEVPYEQLISDYRINAAAQEKFREAAKMQKGIDGFVQQLKAGDLASLKSVVPAEALRQFAVSELNEYLDYENLSEADKGRLAAEKERDQYKSKLEAGEELARKEYAANLEQKVTSELDSEIGEAIREMIAAEGIDPNQPVEPWFLENVCSVMLAQLEGSEDPNSPRMTAKAATKHAWNGVQKTVKSYLNSVPAAKALEMLPQSLRDAIRKADVGDAVSTMQQRIRTKQAARPDVPKKTKNRRVDTNDFFSRIENRWQ